MVFESLDGRITASIRFLPSKQGRGPTNRLVIDYPAEKSYADRVRKSITPLLLDPETTDQCEAASE